MKDKLKCLCFFLFTLYCSITHAQHVIPLSIIAEPDSAEIAIFGNFSFDGSFVSAKTSVLSGKSGFVINTKERRGLYSSRIKNTNIILDFNPIIVGMNPFNWNNIIKQPIDSFYVQRLPYAEDAFLHLGIRSNSRKKQLRTDGKQFNISGLFADLYWRPYILKSKEIEYRFQVININTGYQWAYLQKDIDVIGNVMLSISPQFNYMYINESDDFLSSFEAIAGKRFKGHQFAGTGLKAMLQTNYLNFAFELRHYWALEGEYQGKTFTQNPSLLVSAFYTPKFYTRKRKVTSTNSQPVGGKRRL